MSEVFPVWLTPAWQRLLQACRQGRLPHALLISAASGIGKRLLAERLAALLLCTQSRDGVDVCGRCPPCTWLKAGSHPDLLSIVPEDAGKAIKVDQIRALNVAFSKTSHAGRYKIAIVEPADMLNVNAANSLLKTLEEPTADTLILLLTASPGRLPATIRSRCQRVEVQGPSNEQAQAWLLEQGLDAETATQSLSLAAGAPLLAAEMAAGDSPRLRDERLQALLEIFQGKQDPLRVAPDWCDEHLAQTLQWWHHWLQDLIRERQAGHAPADSHVARELQQISEAVDCKRLFELADRLVLATNSLGSGLNRQLLIEDLLIDWARLAARPARTGAVTHR